MPCFKGLAVSIHTPHGPLPEYSIQKQSRQNRISSYIPVPAPEFRPGSDRPEQSSFAISITLLTPGSVVPYSRPDPTPEDPHPSPVPVGPLSSQSRRGVFTPSVGPYIPLTPSPNETIAAYIHFDGRAKEEVATLLRRGVETWVNSRWVGVPESEGGGLAEREFLFREVGLERWLNGLDLKGKSSDVAAKIERRKQRLERKRRRKLGSRASDEEGVKDMLRRSRPLERNNGILRYGADKQSPVEDVLDDDEDITSSSSDDSEDEMPEPEATGQIKVSLYRVMASGEIKKGEYSPSFDAHDDDDESMQEQKGEDDPGIDHTTTFAKPKTLDPKSISTQTVTGIDDPTKPYATFTFFYRGERQLQKMGIIPNTEAVDYKKAAAPKRKLRQLDFSNLGPLRKEGGAGFAGYRDTAAKASIPNLNNGKRNEDEMDSDGEDDGFASIKRKSQSPIGPSKKSETNGEMDEDSKLELSPEELSKRAELAEGVKKIQLKRQHSFDTSAEDDSAERSPLLPPHSASAASTADTTAASSLTSTSPALPSTLSGTRFTETEAASPFKKQRGSVSTVDAKKLFSSQLSPTSTNFTGGSPDVTFISSQQPAIAASSAEAVVMAEEASQIPLPSERKASNGGFNGSSAIKDEIDGDSEL